ncbi:flagellar hook protein FlgE [Massilia violaceinigra]|nr:flagellar hook-basal body complex protein [Massilia violaceinigra]
MFDSISIGTSGLLTHAKGLRVVGNNLANVNTPGFKSAQLQFAELFDQGSGPKAPQDSPHSNGLGTGVASLGSKINFRAGLDQSTGNPLDLNINGNGFYAVRRDGEILYTRSGDFRFDEKGILVNSAGDQVMGLDSGSKLTEISLDKFNNSAAKATGTVKFRGNLTMTTTTPPIDAKVNAIPVFDANGVSQPISLSFKNNGGGNFTMTATNAANATLSTQQLKFVGGLLDPAQGPLTVNLAAAGAPAVNVKLDFAGITSTSETTTLAPNANDGYVAGARTDTTIDADGSVQVHYSNGQTVKAARLALANFEADSALEQIGGSAFAKKEGSSVQYGFAGTDAFGKLLSGHREGSNVDLAEEFGNLILMQRGYQASSHVISTANDMIQQLFDMKGR